MLQLLSASDLLVPDNAATAEIHQKTVQTSASVCLFAFVIAAIDGFQNNAGIVAGCQAEGCCVCYWAKTAIGKAPGTRK
jgi:hypothetical protein